MATVVHGADDSLALSIKIHCLVTIKLLYVLFIWLFSHKQHISVKSSYNGKRFYRRCFLSAATSFTFELDKVPLLFLWLINQYNGKLVEAEKGIFSYFISIFTVFDGGSSAISHPFNSISVISGCGQTGY